MNIVMSIKKVTVALAVAGALSFIACGQSAFAAPSKKMLEREQAIKAQIIEWNRSQMAAITPSNAQNVWKNVALAPHDFPVPIFSGNESVFMEVKMPPLPQLQNVSQIYIRTKDNPAAVARWYQSRLAGAGLSLDSKLPRTTAPGTQVFKAENSNIVCSIMISGKDLGEPDTTISITAKRKARV